MKLQGMLGITVGLVLCSGHKGNCDLWPAS